MNLFEKNRFIFNKLTSLPNARQHDSSFSYSISIWRENGSLFCGIPYFFPTAVNFREISLNNPKFIRVGSFLISSLRQHLKVVMFRRYFGITLKF